MPLEIYSIEEKPFSIKNIFSDEFRKFLKKYNKSENDVIYQPPKIINNGHKGLEYKGKILGLSIEIKKRILFA